jgi:Tol biopolymer transport system component
VARLLILGFVGAMAIQQPSPPPPPTDIYELRLSGGLATLSSAIPIPVANEKGYENQPFYTADGAAILYAANRDGKQTDIFEYDRAGRRTRAVTTTSEGEFSPTITPDGNGISVIRVEADTTQRLWRVDRDGKNPQLVLKDVKPVGYHVWIDRDRLALFVLGPPSTLQHARVSTGESTVVAERIGRSLHRVPNSTRVSFVHNEGPDGIFVKEFDPATGSIARLIKLREGNSERDVAWTPDGTLLMSAGTKVFAWQRGGQDWREVLDVAGRKLGAVTRMAAAPDGSAIAIVVNEPAP